MQPSRGSVGRLLAVGASLAMVAAACGSGASPSPSASAPASSGGSPSASAAPTKIGGSVSVLAVWTGSEQTQFMNMVKPFEDATGITVKYTGTRDEPTVLTTAIAAGGNSLPDIAGLPGPAQMQQYANAGNLQDLSGVLDLNTYKADTPSSLVDLGTVSGKLVGIFLDVSAKGQIWYDPKVVGDLSSTYPKTWTDFQTLISQDKSKATAPWCFSVESGAATGWPATDLLESFVLHTQGPDYYNNWWAGKVKWTDPGMKSDWQMLGDVVAQSYGGANRILTTNFANAGDPLFTTPPGCLFLHQASFITGLGQFAKETKLTDYNFFPFPSITAQYAGAVEGAGDLFGMFKNTPQSDALMKYLVSAQAQTLFVSGGEFLSANKQVANYPNAMNQALGAILANASSFVFDASDQMPTQMQSEFYKGLVNYIQNPGQLDSILQHLDSVQASAYTQ
jgi:alpha-glucoside transport system substrate-binding protein